MPAPSAVESVGVATLAIIIFLSSTTRSEVLRVVVFPSTVKFPATIKLPPTFTWLSKNPLYRLTCLVAELITIAFS